jgi:hypothetical protein
MNVVRLIPQANCDKAFRALSKAGTATVMPDSRELLNLRDGSAFDGAMKGLSLLSQE